MNSKSILIIIFVCVCFIIVLSGVGKGLVELVKSGLYKTIWPAVKGNYEAVERAKVDKELKAVQLQTARLPYWDHLIRILVPGSTLTVLVCAWFLSWGQFRQKSIHIVKIVDIEIPILHRDLPAIIPAIREALEVKGIEAHFPARFLDKFSQLIRSFGGRRGISSAIPIEGHEVPVLSAQNLAQHEIPTFTELLARRQIAPDHPIVFGVRENGALRTGTWQDIYSNGTGGQSGSGKTTTLCEVIAQSLLHGIHFVILDYHWPHPQSLLARLGDLKYLPLVKFADKHCDYLPLLEYVSENIEYRIQNPMIPHPPSVLVIDEVVALVNISPTTEATIYKLGTQGRKVEWYGLFSAQDWKGDKINTSARDNLISTFAHYMKPNQARPFLQDKEKVDIVKKLKRGQMLFSPVNGDDEILKIPAMVPQDMETIYRMIIDGNTVCVSGDTSQFLGQPKVDNPETLKSSLDLQLDQNLVHALDLANQGQAGDVDLVLDLNIVLDQIRQKSEEKKGMKTELANLFGIDLGFFSKVLSREKACPDNLAVKMQRYLRDQKSVKSPLGVRSNLVKFPDRKP